MLIQTSFLSEIINSYVSIEYTLCAVILRHVISLCNHRSITSR
nr:MAG TPA: hypothetical protein [Caudoviricetes sp.]